MKSSYRVLDEERKFKTGDIVWFDSLNGNWEHYNPNKHEFFWGMVMDREGDIAVISICSDDYKKEKDLEGK